MNKHYCAILSLIPALILSGCFLKPKKKSAKKGTAAYELIDRENIYLDRIGDGTSASIKFQTGKNADCELAFYSQEENGTPTREKPEVVPCQNPVEGRTKFAEKIPNLKTDTLYFVIISAWETGADRSTADTVTVKESQNNPGVINPGGDEEDTKLEMLWVARLNIPLLTAEFHRHVLPEPLDIPTLKTRHSREIGCINTASPPAAPFREADKNIMISGLATRDFAAGSAIAHPDHPGRMLATYRSANDAPQWSLIYSLENSDKLITVRPVSRLVNVEMESSAAMAFEKPQLAEAADPLKIDPDKPLQFAWTTNGSVLDTAYLNIHIGRPGYDKSIYCTFPASKQTASIESRYLKELDDGKHVVLVELSSTLLWVKDNWSVTTYDWRSGRIEK